MIVPLRPLLLAGLLASALPATPRQDAKVDPQVDLTASSLLAGRRAAQDPPQDAPQERAEQDPDAQEKDSAKAKKTRRQQIAEKKKELAKSERELVYAQMEVKIAGMKAEEDVDKARLDVAGFVHALEAAKRAQHAYAEVEARTAGTEAGLQIERAEHRLKSDEEDLQGILRIYAEETEASAKPEIIRRHEKSVEFARQELVIARSKAAKVLEHDIPAKIADLEWAVSKADADLRRGKSAERRTELAGQLDVTKKEDAETELEKKIKQLRRDLEKLGAGEDASSK